jgi:SPW repeat
MATQFYDTGRPARSHNWQDWANLILAIWLFISPWVLNFAIRYAAGEGAATGTTMPMAESRAAWDAWVLGVIVFLVSLSAIGRMEMWQERVNLVLGIWIFIAPWVLGFTELGKASFDHWVVGALVFLISVCLLAQGRRATVIPTTTRNRFPPGV